MDYPTYPVTNKYFVRECSYNCNIKCHFHLMYKYGFDRSKELKLLGLLILLLTPGLGRLSPTSTGIFNRSLYTLGLLAGRGRG